MAPWGKDGSWIVSDCFGAAAYHLNVKIACRCGHFVCFHGACLWWLLHKNGQNDAFWNMRRRYYCRPCFKRTGLKVRPSIEGTKDPITAALPWPSELEWKQAQRRVR